MRLFQLLLAWGAIVNCAMGQEARYQQKTLSEWRTQTQQSFSLSERQEAIQALESLAREHMRRRTPPRPEDIQWVASEIVPTLANLLHDKETAIQERAIRTFHWFPDASHQAAGALIALLDDKGDDIRVAAAAALVSIEHNAVSRVIPVLNSVVRKNGNSAIGGSAAAILASTAVGREGMESLMALLNDKDEKIHLTVTNAIRFGCQPPADALPVFQTLLKDENADVRANALAIISRIRPPTRRAATAMIPLLADKNSYVRRTAIWSLSEMRVDGRDVLPEMIKLVDDKDRHVRNTLAVSLGAMGSEAVTALTSLLDDKYPDVRGHAAASLGRIGPAAKEAVPALKRLLTDTSPVGDEGGASVPSRRQGSRFNSW